MRRWVLIVIRQSILAFCICAAVSAQAPSTAAGAPGLKPILNYISSAWDTLTRSMTDCQSLVDPKIAVRPVLYLPKGFPEPSTVKTVAANCNVRVEELPAEIHHLGEITTGNIDPPGLLYLPSK